MVLSTKTGGDIVNKILYVVLILGVLYMTLQIGRWWGFNEGKQVGHDETIEAIGRSTVDRIK